MKKPCVIFLALFMGITCLAQSKEREELPLKTVLQVFSVVQRGDCQTLEALLKAGLDPNTVGPWEHNLLMEAVIQREECAVRLLLSAGADATVAANHRLVSMACANGDYQIVKDLVEIGKARISRTPGTKDWDSPLVAAVVGNSEEIFYYLLDHGADPNDKDIFGVTPLMMASAKGRVDWMMALKEHGADFSLGDSIGKTALMYACEEGEIKAIEYLLQNGANACQEDGYGKTASSYSIAKGVAEDVVKMCTCKK